MAINQIGRINFTDLKRYTWQETDFESFQEYMESYFKELSSGGWASGLIYGGALSVVSGLTVQVDKLLANFSGQILTMDVSNIALSAADATNPRIDRIELELTEADGSTVTNLDNQTKTFDKKFTGVLHVNAGTPAATPVPPNLTAGRLSLGLVSVAANQVLLTSVDLDQSDYARDLARKLDPTERTSPIANNQATFTAIQNLRFNSTFTKYGKASGYIYRKTDSSETLTPFSVEAVCKSAVWSMADIVVKGDDSGVEFDIDETTGAIKYKSTSVAGSNYQGSIVFRIDSRS